MKYECRSCYDSDRHFNKCVIEVPDGTVSPSKCVYGADNGGGELNEICEWVEIVET